MRNMYNERYNNLLNVMKEKDWDCVILWPSQTCIISLILRNRMKGQIAFCLYKNRPLLYETIYR